MLQGLTGDLHDNTPYTQVWGGGGLPVKDSTCRLEFLLTRVYSKCTCLSCMTMQDVPMDS